MALNRTGLDWLLHSFMPSSEALCWMRAACRARRELRAVSGAGRARGQPDPCGVAELDRETCLAENSQWGLGWSGAGVGHGHVGAQGLSVGLGEARSHPQASFPPRRARLQSSLGLFCELGQSLALDKCTEQVNIDMYSRISMKHILCARHCSRPRVPALGEQCCPLEPSVRLEMFYPCASKEWPWTTHGFGALKMWLLRLQS